MQGLFGVVCDCELIAVDLNSSWVGDPDDTQLIFLCSVWERDIDDVTKVLGFNDKSFKWICDQANQPLSAYETHLVEGDS